MGWNKPGGNGEAKQTHPRYFDILLLQLFPGECNIAALYFLYVRTLESRTAKLDTRDNSKNESSIDVFSLQVYEKGV